MKRAGIALMLVAVFGLATSAATADVSVWFTSADLGVTQQGEGLPLIIEKPAGPGRFEFQITMMANITGGNLVGYSQDIWRSPGDTAVTAKAWNNLAFIPSVFLVPPTLNDPATGGDAIINDGGNGDVTFVGITGIQPLMSFTVSVNKASATPGAVHDLFAAIGQNFYAPQQQITFAGNAPIAANDATLQPLPVISIVNVPEPGTLALLGIGLFGLVRRRRR